MISLYPLIQNETTKMLKKRRFLVVLLIIAILIPVFTYAQMRVAENTRKQLGTTDWRVSTQKRIIDWNNSMSNNIPEEYKKYRKLEIQRLQYALDHNINPQSPDAVTFTREFIRNSITLFLPLLVAVLASDIVSSEQSTGTIKLLLTRPVRRWKILMSKLITLILFTSLIILAMGVMAYLISGLFFGYAGWNFPVLTGYQISGDVLNTGNVYPVPQWLFIIMEFGLAWYSCVVVACLTLMVSVLVRSTAAGMGIMLATLIAGTILANMASSWESAKYLFMINLDTVAYLTGTLQTIPGLNLTFSLWVLTVWAAASLVIAFRVFTKRDMLS